MDRHEGENVTQEMIIGCFGLNGFPVLDVGVLFAALNGLKEFLHFGQNGLDWSPKVLLLNVREAEVFLEDEWKLWLHKMGNICYI